ncbi:MAG TPA: DNA internalization-related competence protein ComEC/Rec2 [Gaiellaceae bacterium]|nr:DNA internalization-related competence protein ComEC/Rec2 [Gaiellaceae bacterium]
MIAVAARFPQHALALALVAGLAAASAARVSLAVAVAVAALASAATVLASREARIVGFAGVLAVGAWWFGSVRLDALDRSVLAAEEGTAGRAVVVVTGPARAGTYSVRVPARVERFRDAPVRERVLLRLPAGRAPPQGARLELVATVRAPRDAVDAGGFDERRWLARQGVHVVLAAGRWTVVGRRGGLGGVADRLRAHLTRTIGPRLAGERRAVLAGIVLGEDEGLSHDLRDAFRASGLYHLLAVSGQNVAFIAGGVLLLAWLLGVPRLAAEVAIVVAVVGYVLAVGWQPSVVRAGVAGILASLAWLAARERDRWYFMLLGALVLLAWNPYALLEPGFQLSFSAVAAIFVAVPRLQRWLEGFPLPRLLRDVAAISTACGLVTAPILWLHFGAVPVYSVPANALAAPVVAPLLGIGLACAAVHPVAPGAAAALAWLNGWLAAYLAACARLVAAVPGAQVSSAAAAVLLLAAAATAILLLRVRGRDRRVVVALACVAVAAVAAWKLVPQEAPPPRGLRVSFLDVGQGDAILLQTRRHAVLFDQGPPEARVWKQLRALGVRRLALLVITHPDRDHVGGAAEVLAKLRVDAVLDSGVPPPGPEGRDALEEARRRGVPVIQARAGTGYRLGALRLRVLWPRRPAREGQPPNDHGVVVLASYGALDLLLTGDAESHVVAPLRPPRAEILKVAHHGSADPFLPQLLDRVRPRIAVVSAGRGNGYGHPAPSTLAALRGLRVYRTDRDGRVTLETDGERVRILQERK